MEIAEIVATVGKFLSISELSRYLTSSKRFYALKDKNIVKALIVSAISTIKWRLDFNVIDSYGKCQVMDGAVRLGTFKYQQAENKNNLYQSSGVGGQVVAKMLISYPTCRVKYEIKIKNGSRQVLPLDVVPYNQTSGNTFIADIILGSLVKS